MTAYQKVLLSAVFSLVFATSFLLSQDSHVRIVRISYAEGAVQLNNQNVTINMPLIEGNVLSTGSDSVAEVEFEGGSRLRLGPDTQITLAQLARLSSGEALTRVDLEEGEAELILNRRGGQFALSAANKNIQLSSSGRFRIFRSKAEPLELAVWKGEATVHDSDTGEDVSVSKDETFTLAADDPQQYDLEPGVQADDLDEFSQTRDQYLASNYVSNTPAQPVSIFGGFVDPCASFYWYPGIPLNCFSPYYWYPSFYNNYYYVPGPGYPRHPHRRPPIIRPPAPVLAGKGGAVDRVLRGQPVKVGVVGPTSRPVRVFDEENFKRSAPEQEEQKAAETTDQESQRANGVKESSAQPQHSEIRGEQVEPRQSHGSRNDASRSAMTSGPHTTHSSAPSSGGSRSFSGSASHYSGGGSHSSGSSGMSSHSSGSSGSSSSSGRSH